MRLTAPSAAVDCGSSGAALTLLSGILAAQPFVTRLVADDFVSRRSMRGLMEPLDAMGATVKATGPDKSAPLTVSGRFPLDPVRYPRPVDDAEDMAAVLLAGLFTSGRTSLMQAFPMPDHFERVLRHYQVKTRRDGLTVSVYGGQVPESRDFRIPGDLSCAANWIAAAAAQPGSDLLIRGVGLNATRSAFLRVLVRMGAQILEDIKTGTDAEPEGNVIVRGATLRGTIIGEHELPALSEELPALMVAASLAAGSTKIRTTTDERDRLGRMARNLRLMGVEIGMLNNGIEIKGTAGAPMQPGCLPSGGDLRIAMASAIAGLFTEGETIVENTACIESAYAGFHHELRSLQRR
jgi:3-phosphoshikimate 1-carboxyvinyltransferase